MALQAWFPLNGSYVNYGLGSYTNIQYNGTLDADGKTGSCYVFSGKYFRIDGGIIAGLDSFSIACWAYLTSTNYQIFTFETSGAWWQFVLEKDYLRVRDTVTGISGSRLNIPITPIPQNTWVHVVVVYDKGNIYVYQGGVLKDVLHGNINASMNAENTVLCIGADVANSTSAYPGNCKVNDFRVYDHCLSAKEVKELSKGLIVHYKLSENCQTMDNCYANPTFDSGSQTAGWNHWASEGSGSCSQNTNKDYIYNKDNTYSHKISYNAGGRYLCLQSPSFEGGYRSVQAIIKLEDGGEPTTDKIRFGWNANVGTTPPTRFFPLGDGFYLMKVDGFRQSGSNNLVAIMIYSGITAYISEAYLENDRKVCTDILNASPTVITDRSGYGRHAARMTPLIMEVDSPRYDLCVANSENYPLRATFDFPQTSGLTVACWVNMATWGWQGSGVFSTSGQIASTPTDYNSTTFNHYDGYIRMRGANGTTYNIACSTISDIPVNGWHHVALTHDGSQANLYIDGVLKRTVNVPTPLVAFKRLYLGTSFAGGTNRACQGKWSDFRMYATALSAEDVADLYHTSAIVDNKGDLMCYQAVELSDSLLRYELTTINTNPANTSSRGKMETAYGVLAMRFMPTDTYFAAGDERNQKLFCDMFKENTQYMFDLWINADNVTTSSYPANQGGGFYIHYTDGTRYDGLVAYGANYQETPIGFQHKVYVSEPGKTIKRLAIRYAINASFWVRADSFIAEVADPSIGKTGNVMTGQFVEGYDIAETGRADVKENVLMEI